MPDFNAKFAFNSPAEEADFLHEISLLPPAQFHTDDRAAHLLVIYRRLVAERSPFSLQLREATPPQDRPPLLQPWLATWATETREDDLLYDALLLLDARGLEAAVLQRLVLTPPFLRSAASLGLLRAAPLPAVRQWSDLLTCTSGTISTENLLIAYRLILETFFHEAGEWGEWQELNTFLHDVLPALMEKFPLLGPQQEILRLADWFQLWAQHYRQTVPNLPRDHPYYQLPFTTIVKYLPAVILWNNGIPYRDGAKAFAYYSEAYFWLATGGSLRKIPGHPPYSKRMAKEFLALPVDLITGDADIYVYCFLRSLEASHDLAVAVQRFFRRPASITELMEWKARLDPVVQKLNEVDYHWPSGQGDHLLGYLHHAVRDQFGFAVNIRPVEQLEQEAAAYYERIAARRAEAERRNAARKSPPAKDSWRPLAGVSSWEEEGDRFSPVRRWTITELTGRYQLEAESAQMRHCVSTYLDKCRHGQASIWSMRELRQNGNWHSLVTLEIAPRQRCIVQVSARLNARPNSKLMERIEKWAEREKLRIDIW